MRRTICAPLPKDSAKYRGHNYGAWYLPTSQWGAKREADDKAPLKPKAKHARAGKGSKRPEDDDEEVQELLDKALREVLLLRGCRVGVALVSRWCRACVRLLVLLPCIGPLPLPGSLASAPIARQGCARAERLYCGAHVCITPRAGLGELRSPCGAPDTSSLSTSWKPVLADDWLVLTAWHVGATMLNQTTGCLAQRIMAAKAPSRPTALIGCHGCVLGVACRWSSCRAPRCFTST